MDHLITPAEADAIIAASITSLGSESIDLTKSIGRTLAEPILADRDLPPYSRAMMDGIAFSSHSSPPFTITGLHAAGNPPPGRLAGNHAWEIMTGACIPEDCDTVVPYEHLSDDFTIVKQVYQEGQFIHKAGTDAKARDVLVAKGQRIGPAEVAIAASVGLTHLKVVKRPRIALVSSGDEAVPVDAHPEPWQIRRSNGPMLEAALLSSGYPIAAHHHIPDEPEASREILDEAFHLADIIILCGGISKGKRDFIRPLVEEKLGTPTFHGVLQRPGKPLAYWNGPPHIFALPGNPISVLATFTRYVLPALVQLDGRSYKPQKRMLPEGVQPLPQLTWLLALNDSGKPLPPSNSGDFVSIAGAHGFLEIPPASGFDPSQIFNYHPFAVS